LRLFGAAAAVGLLAGGIGLYAAPGVKPAAQGGAQPLASPSPTTQVQPSIVERRTAAELRPRATSPEVRVDRVGGAVEVVPATKVFEDPWQAIQVPYPDAPGEGGTANVTYLVGFEPGEDPPAYLLGLIVGQAGWCRFGAPGCPAGTDPASLIDPSVSNANPSLGVQHLRMAGDPMFTPGTLIRAFSPSLGPNQVSTSHVSLCILITNEGGADYHVRPFSPDQGLVSSYIVFHFADLGMGPLQVPDPDAIGPDIVVLDDPPGAAMLALYATGREWVPGVYMQLDVYSYPTINTQLYHYGPKGAVGPVIYTGAVFGATTVQSVEFRSDNSQLESEAGYVDKLSVTVKPVPGACCSNITAARPCSPEGTGARNRRRF
jgi:hypothetical protein